MTNSSSRRVPVNGASEAGRAVEILLDQPIHKPDGVRAANGKLLVAENGSGKISAIKTPTAVEPAGDTIWIAERGAGKAVSIPMPK